MTKAEIFEALVTAMAHCKSPMVLTDPEAADWPMVAVNQAFCDATGYDVAESVGRNCRFLQGPRTDPTAGPRIRACLDEGQGCVEWILNYKKDGAKFWNLLFISPVRDVYGRLLYYFGNQLDVTLGFPDWMAEVQFGRAHVLPALETEFHALLREVRLAQRVEALGRIVSSAHRLAEITAKLAPGTLGRA